MSLRQISLCFSVLLCFRPGVQTSDAVIHMSPKEFMTAMKYASGMSLHDCPFGRRLRTKQAKEPLFDSVFEFDRVPWKNSDVVVNSSLYGTIRKWPDGVIPYGMDGSFPAHYRQKVFNAMVSVERNTCIRFVPDLPTPRSTVPYAYLYISWHRKSSCKAHLGRKTSVPNLLMVGIPRCAAEGTIMHELLHTIGLLHEQMREVRDRFVQILWRNIDVRAWRNFRKDDGYVMGTPYDYDSIMHYGKTAFSINRNPTTWPLEKDAHIGQRDGLSYWDVKKVNVIYNCDRKAEHCLDAISERKCTAYGLIGRRCLSMKWARAMCPRTCGLCPDQIEKIRCTDQVQHCSYWHKSGFCAPHSPQFPAVSKLCQKTCGVCW